MGFPVGSVVKNPPASAGDLGSIPVLGSSPGEENGNPFQYSCPGNPMDMDKGVWQATQSMGLQRVGHNLATKQQQYTILINNKQYDHFSRQRKST